MKKILFNEVKIACVTVWDVREALRQESINAGSRKVLAERLGVSPQYLGDVINKKREPGEAILKAMGLQKLAVYEVKK